MRSSVTSCNMVLSARPFTILFLPLPLLLLTFSSANALSAGVSLGSLSISPVAMGTLNLLPNEPDTIKEILQLLPSGTLIDTGETYGKGKAEETLAAAANDAGTTLGKGLLTATKFSPSTFRTSSQSVVEACRASSKRLGVDSIDLYQIHYQDSNPLVQLGVLQELDEVYWDGLAECFHQGLARNVGVCNYGPTMVRRAYQALAKRGVPLVSNQIGFNLMRYGITKETKQVCDDLGIKVLAYSPVSKGVLSGLYDPHDESTLPQQPRGRYYRLKRCLLATTELRAVMAYIAQGRGTTFPQITYNWSICKGTIPISGAKTAAQVSDIVHATEWRLTEEEIASLDTVAGDNISPAKEFVLN